MNTNREMSLETTSPVLEAAFRLVEKGAVDPREIRKRVRTLGMVLLIGVITLGTTAIAIRNLAAANEPARLLAGFIVLASVTVLVAAGIGLAILLWDAFVRQRVYALHAEREMTEVVGQLSIVLNVLRTMRFERECGDAATKIIQRIEAADPSLGSLLEDDNADVHIPQPHARAGAV